MKRILILALVLSAASITVAVQSPSAQPEVKYEAPKYLLVWRERNLSMQGARWVTEVMPFQSIDEALVFLTKKDIDDERFVGIWELGKPLPNISLSTKEETVKRRTREWKRP